MAAAGGSVMTHGAVARHFGRAAGTYDAYARVQAEVAARLASRLPTDLPVPFALDLGCGTASMAQTLRAHLPHVGWLGMDIAEGMLRQARQVPTSGYRLVAGDASRLPLGNQSMGLVFSSFALQWCDDPGIAVAELGRVLCEEGWLLLAVPVAGTLYELEESWRQVDAGAHVNRLVSAARWEETLTAAGFVSRHCEAATFVEYYPSVTAIHRMLKATGAHHVTRRTPVGLTTPARLRALEAAYARLASHQGLPVTWQVAIMVFQRL